MEPSGAVPVSLDQALAPKPLEVIASRRLREIKLADKVSERARFTLGCPLSNGFKHLALSCQLCNPFRISAPGLAPTLRMTAPPPLPIAGDMSLSQFFSPLLFPS
jgi:hypothetical protein